PDLRIEHRFGIEFGETYPTAHQRHGDVVSRIELRADLRRVAGLIRATHIVIGFGGHLHDGTFKVDRLDSVRRHHVENGVDRAVAETAGRIRFEGRGFTLEPDAEAGAQRGLVV